MSTSSAAPAVHCVNAVTLTDFRNYTALKLVLGSGPVVLYGKNGAGKTNLLEAISYLTPGRGLRGARPEDVARRPVLDSSAPGKRWAVAASVTGPTGPLDLGTAWDAPTQGGSARRRIKLNGAPAASQSALAEVTLMTWVTPQMGGLFVEGATGRRRFIDRLALTYDPAHAGRSTAYEKALRQRSKLLKEQGPNADPAWLTALEAQIAERGIAVAAARLDLVDRLHAVAKHGFGPFPGAALSMRGQVEDLLSAGSALEAEEALLRALYDGRGEDAKSGGASVGPHRSDLAVDHLEKNAPADQCSTGEQKALLLALILAHARMLSAEKSVSPMLLLDDVAAHLDAERRAALFEAVLSFRGQCWMTGTDRSLFDPMHGNPQFFQISDGGAEPIPSA